jgi:hypothetical protein
MPSISLAAWRRSLAALAAFGVAAAAHAGTVTVCLDGSCDFTDPAAAVDAAVAGDTVLIAAGTYPLTSTVTAYGKHLTIRGAVDTQGRPATVLDGQGERNVLGVLSVTNQMRFENLVLTNGRADYGGGVFLSSASPVFQNCHIRDNVARFGGGGILLSQTCSPTFLGCEITGNHAGTAKWPGQGSGGAMKLGSGTVTLVDCAVSGNSAGGVGGGFILVSSSTLVLESTRVCGNSAPNGAQVHLNGGGGSVTEGAGSCILDDCDDCPEAPACPADLNGDALVNAADLASLLAEWGACGTGSCPADLTGDGTVNGADLGSLLGSWGGCD